ncbi:hypothetical protein OROHE_004822 [Orobanche hederae]
MSAFNSTENEETPNTRLVTISLADREDGLYYLSEKAPFFDVILAKSHVNPGTSLILPVTVHKMLPCAVVPVVLRYGGKNWTVSYTGDSSRPRFGSKWKNFVIDNRLKCGDACVFELTDPSRTKPVFKVHILRADLPPELMELVDIREMLQVAQAIQIEELIEADKLEMGKGQNQIGSLQRPGEIVNDKAATSRAVADKAYDMMMSFEFVFVLHFLVELLGRANDLCRMLQCISQDIVNSMDVVSNMKQIIQNFRENGWDELLMNVKNFCEEQAIEIPDMNEMRRSSRGRSPQNPVTWEHHYRIDIFSGTIDCILQELRIRFNEDVVELLKLSSCLDPRRGYELFNIGNICKLAEKFYPVDFSSQEKLHLKISWNYMNLTFEKMHTFSMLLHFLNYAKYYPRQ